MSAQDWEMKWDSLMGSTRASILRALRNQGLTDTDSEQAIELPAPRRITSTDVANLTSHCPAAALLTGSAILCATSPLWWLCVAAPLVIYIWWLVTSATIQAAALLDDHPIPPARLLSEGPR